MSQFIGKKVQKVLNYEDNYGRDETKPKTIFEELRDSERIPPQERTLTRLTDECSVLLIAGSESPGKALGIILYHIMVNPDKLQRLRGEIKAIPFLAAVIYEGLRLHSGIITRTPRMAPEPLQYKQWRIPERTPLICMSPFIHFNRGVFPELWSFVPERWIILGTDGQNAFNTTLKRHFVAVGKGTRACLGYNLGFATLYLSVAALVMEFEMKPFDTTIRDVQLERDWMIPQPQLGSQGVEGHAKREAERAIVSYYGCSDDPE